MSNATLSAPYAELPSRFASAIGSWPGPLQLIPRQQANARLQVRACLLGNGSESLCVLLPAAELLDLVRLEQATGVRWQAVPDQQAQLCQQLDLASLPAVPGIHQHPCLYADSLALLPEVQLECGLAGQLVRVPVATYLHNHPTAPISRPLPADHDSDSLPLGELVNLTVRRIEQQLGKTLELPPLSLTARKILQLRSQPDAHVDDLTAIIETDPALSAQLLSWASSPLYGAGRVHSIEDAIIRVLGFELVMNLALGLALNTSFTLPASYERYSRQHWQQALQCATLIEGLVRRMPAGHRPEPGLAYLAGLLHNFGHLLLAQLFPHYFQLIQQHELANPQLSGTQIDQLLLGITRSAMGATLMQKWHMPEELVHAVARQQGTDHDSPHARYAWLVQLACQLLQTDDSNPLPADSLQLCRHLQLEPEQVLAERQRILAAEEALRSFVA